jgi:membrane-bound acyltransferase YfiQ involved in biofilm formation
MLIIYLYKFAGLFDTLFSWKFFVPLSRLTYSIYLIHMTIVDSHMFSVMTTGYLSDYNMVSTMTVMFISLIRPTVKLMTRGSKPCYGIMTRTQLQWLRQSVAGLTPHRLRFEITPLHVRPVVG